MCSGNQVKEWMQEFNKTEWRKKSYKQEEQVIENYKNYDQKIIR